VTYGRSGRYGGLILEDQDQHKVGCRQRKVQANR